MVGGSSGLVARYIRIAGLQEGAEFVDGRDKLHPRLRTKGAVVESTIVKENCCPTAEEERLGHSGCHVAT
jgi:hypothetical protein